MQKKEQFDYCSKLRDGLQININKKKLDEHLICFELSYETDSDVYKRFEVSSLEKDVSDCYLIHKTSNEKKYAVDEESTAKNRLYFDDIDFSVSDKDMDFDIQIDKSEISTGAAAGDLTNPESDKYIYTHPINDEETEIVISFKNVCISNTFSVDVEL